MPDLILHHYETSPFSEKIRLVLGDKTLAWTPVILTPPLPKPHPPAPPGRHRPPPLLPPPRRAG